MDATQIIIKPLITEKSAWEAEGRNRYAFEVHPTANKTDVKRAIQEIYKVRVLDVATQNRPGRTHRTRFGIVQNRDWKRAVVKLHAEDKIEFF